ncbi:hypothetical protein [Cognatilysobacter bugurensis]|uniref:Poly-gamma-glutamate synthase PgsB n=1 Tax=Cognatilysobacter bugurensis TaxID=543356 RepID=A0A918T2H1_9GAMM|nr:hypothetical protein [Lysobacter bugurensis]GHA80159.1 hypothetical protein GCM10007067_17300 [Lysobacter bugurensis]
MTRAARIAALLDRNILAMWRKLDMRERNAVVREFIAWPGARLPSREDDAAVWEQLELARYLREQLETLAARHGRLTHAFRVFQERLLLAETERVRHELMLEFLASLGASERQLRGDRRALQRWLDADAVAERHDRERARIERRIRFCLERLGPLAQHLCTVQPDIAGTPIWDVLDLERSLRVLLGFPGDPRIRESALACLRTALAGLGTRARTQLARSTVQYLYRAVLDSSQAIWLQCEALETLARFAPDELQRIAEQRLARREDSDAMFFRRRMVEALTAALPSHPHYASALEQLLDDPAPFVRKAVAEALPRLPAPLALAFWQRLVDDPVPAVAGQALLQSISLVLEPALHAPIASRFIEGLDESRPEFPLRVAIHLAPSMLERVRIEFPEHAEALHAQLEARLTALHTGHPSTAMRRRAAAARERLRPHDAPAGLERLPLHARTVTSWRADPLDAARALLPRAERGFGFNLEAGRRGLIVLRDWRWRPRLWRMLQEARRPATDKRQNYPHTRGRVYPGLVHVPSGCVAEVSPTKVPGEPLHIAEEDGWRPWLPLLDQVLSALDQDWPTQPLRIVTAEGVTHVTVPDRLVDRLRAKWRLTVGFADIAALRNWTRESAFTPHAFVDALRECGVQCAFEPHAARDGAPYPVDPRVRRFFAAAALPAWAAPLGDVRDYFYSIHQNNLSHLLVFVGAIAAWFFGQHMWLNRMFRSARARLPLVMGGWGTRGKSGTERLKAGVMSALGLRVLSKTTGCEAMFLFGHPNRPLSEMFLFRPYDKATIWEQARLTRIAAALDTDVMMWECMGLNPGYVRVLQHDWMRDDVSTITNCFPDHEDIQGPAGVDLPLVIGEFIPRGGELYTSEENMLPYLAERARGLDTRFVSTNWLDVGLLTPDILARFPYQEHPANVALVARMFEGLGLRRDFALKEMADRVVPDLGVLKIYPEATFEGRRIEFINGMSANERHGCLSNWARTGMAEHRLDIDAGTWTVTVVNNRADRVARSQVFAAILVNDIGADRHYLIGGNLDGLQQFIREAFDEFVASFDWTETEQGIDEHTQMLDALLRRWRVALDDAQADARLRAAAHGLGVAIEQLTTPEALLDALDTQQPAHAATLRTRWEHDRADAARVRDLHARVAAPDAQTAAAVHDLLWSLFSVRIVPVTDYYTPGNVLVHRVLSDAPPGLRIRAMGIQNIKGTGLDFIYRWQAWDLHAAQCAALRGEDSEAALAAAQALAGSTELGVLEAETLRNAIAAARESRLGQTDVMQGLLARIERNLEASLQAVAAYGDARPEQSNRAWAWLVQTAERLLDAGDAVRRRRQANRIYADLVDGRIASARAAYELKRLTQRQKGGWLGA